MSNLTYRELLEKLQQLTEDQLDCNISIYIPWDDEYIPVDKLIFAGVENDVLDEDTPILQLAGEIK